MKNRNKCIMADFEKTVLLDEATHRGPQLCGFANIKCPTEKKPEAAQRSGKFGASGERMLVSTAFISEK